VIRSVPTAATLQECPVYNNVWMIWHLMLAFA
jgi:hypothetical protein